MTISLTYEDNIAILDLGGDGFSGAAIAHRQSNFGAGPCQNFGRLCADA